MRGSSLRLLSAAAPISWWYGGATAPSTKSARRLSARQRRSDSFPPGPGTDLRHRSACHASLSPHSIAYSQPRRVPWTSGFWRIGLAGDAETDLKDALGPQRVALVLGAEGEGMRHNTRQHCDALAKLPISDAIESLNVSNAAAVALYELAGRRAGAV